MILFAAQSLVAVLAEAAQQTPASAAPSASACWEVR